MNKEQWRAIYAYCEEQGFERPSEMLEHFKKWGLMKKESTIEDLSGMVNGDGYNTMIRFLRRYGA